MSKGVFKKFVLWGLLVALLISGIFLIRLLRVTQRVLEIPVKVVEVKKYSPSTFLVPWEAVVENSGWSAWVSRLRYLRTERLKVKILGKTGENFLLKSEDLKAGDLIVLSPEVVNAGQAVNPVTGLTDERLIFLVLEAGMNAVLTEDLEESIRFISPDYKDGLGFNHSLIRLLLKRAYNEFNDSKFELAESPLIHVEDNRAIVNIKVKLSATYRGRHNYLLGDDNTPNLALLNLNKTANGWKVTHISGLRPLGFEERFLKLLGAEVGLPLTKAEVQERNKACMLCRSRMAERFGSGDKNQ